MIFNYIVKIVCEKENILYNDLISSCKKQNLAFSRMMISKLTYENSGFNLSKIAKLLGNKNHSTIIYGIKTIDNSLKLKDNIFPNYKYYEQNVKDYRDNLFNKKRDSNTTINE
jgi:chromosomal replication initiation ATPase DnaA